MAKSKYQQELEDFKKSLPEIIDRHLDLNGITVCETGLYEFFKELDVPYEPRQYRQRLLFECEVTAPDLDEFFEEVITNELLKDLGGVLKKHGIDVHEGFYIADYRQV